MSKNANAEVMENEVGITVPAGDLREFQTVFAIDRREQIAARRAEQEALDKMPQLSDEAIFTHLQGGRRAWAESFIEAAGYRRGLSNPGWQPISAEASWREKNNCRWTAHLRHRHPIYSSGNTDESQLHAVAVEIWGRLTKADRKICLDKMS